MGVFTERNELLGVEKSILEQSPLRQYASHDAIAKSDLSPASSELVSCPPAKRSLVPVGLKNKLSRGPHNVAIVAYLRNCASKSVGGKACAG